MTLSDPPYRQKMDVPFFEVGAGIDDVSFFCLIHIHKRIEGPCRPADLVYLQGVDIA